MNRLKHIADQSKGVSPMHYAIPGTDIELIDLIHAKSRVSTDTWGFFLWASCLQYLWRFDLKGEPSKDLGKAMTYLTWLKQAVDGRREERTIVGGV